MQQSFKLGVTNHHFKWVNPGTVPYFLEYPMQRSLKLGTTMHHFKWVKPGTVHYFLEYPMQQSLKLGTPNHHFKWVKGTCCRTLLEGLRCKKKKRGGVMLNNARGGNT